MRFTKKGFTVGARILIFAGLMVACCLNAHAQNIEGQPIAAQYGVYQITGYSDETSTTGFTFPAGACQVSGGGSNFVGVSAGIPIKIVDGNPLHTEIATPSAVNINACTVAVTTTYNHQVPYFLTSGTGGLQEAINANGTGSGANTIVIDAQWYKQVPPGVAATVIASVHGNTSLGLVDVTTTPYTTYSWNGSAYVSNGALPAATAPGQVPTSLAAGTNNYIAAAPGTIATLPGTPNVVYSFIATGDQGTSTTIHDISGNANNATGTWAVNPWTGLGWSMTSSSNFGYFTSLPASVTQDNTYCISAYLPYQTNPSGPPGGLSQTFALVDSGHYSGWSFSAVWNATNINALYASAAQLNSYVIANQSTAGFHTKCWVQGLSGNSTKDRFFTDGIEDSYLSQNGPNGGSYSGSWFIGAQAGATNQTVYYYLAAWAAQLTPTQVQIASQAMTAAVTARGVQTSPPVFYNNTPRFMAVGDSITCCGGASTTNWWPSLISINSAYGTPVNEGIGGLPAEGMSAAAKWRDAPYCYGGGQRTTAVVYGGINEGYLGLSVAQAIAGIQGYVSTMTAAGCQVGVVTMISCCNGSPALDSFKDSLNPLIRQGAGTGGYFLIDSDDPNLQCDGCSSSGTYFNSDHIHPTNAGQTLLAALISNGVNAYGIGAASQANPTIYTANTVSMLSADRFVTAEPTSTAAYTLPDCLGVTGATYQIYNASTAADIITFSGKTSEAITGLTTLAGQAPQAAIFQATLISQAAAGCGWQRVQ